jgi:hypothetical protein
MQYEDYEGALVELSASFELYPTRAAVFNLGICEKFLHHYVAALRWLERWQREFAGMAPDEERRIVDETVAELRGFVGEITIAASVRGALVRLDGTPVGTTPLSAPVIAEVGRHTIDVTAEGHRAAHHEVAVVSGEPQVVELTLALERPSPTEYAGQLGAVVDTHVAVQAVPAEATAAGVHQAWFWTFAGTAVAIAVGGATTAWMTTAKEEDFQAAATRCQLHEFDACDEATTLAGEYDDYQLATNILFPAAGAFAATALILAFFTDFGSTASDSVPAASTAVPVPVTVGLGSSGLILGVELSF